MSQSATVVRKLPRSKRIAFVAVAILLGWALTELICLGLLTYVEKTYKISSRKIQVEVQQTGDRGKSSVEAIHPYLGWVINPQAANASASLFDRTIPVNSLGFLDEEQGIPKRSPDRVIVAVTGGSVAWQVSVAGEKLLRETLEKSPQFQGKKLQLVRLAMSGYKQPQQLMSLNYMLALGAEFDVLVNVDGYNEVALTIAENDECGVFIAYPRMWHARLQDVVDPRKYPLSFRLFQLRGWRQQMAADRLNSWLPWSPILNLIWFVRDKRLESQIRDMGIELSQRKRNEGMGFNAVGPAQLYRGTQQMHQQVCDVWSNCSQQLSKLCAANGIAYIHILQPNQYLPNSKTMTAKEREASIYEYQEYGIAIAKVYPLLIKKGDELRKAGMDFHDLTMLFSKIAEPIYADPFCHYNQRGNDLLATSIADFILAAMRK